jgi:hypothetical protein
MWETDTCRKALKYVRTQKKNNEKNEKFKFSTIPA